MRSRHAHADDWTPPHHSRVDDTPLFAPPREPTPLARWLRERAASTATITLDADTCRALTRLGVTLDLPAKGANLGDCTPAQALRYADELEKANA